MPPLPRFKSVRDHVTITGFSRRVYDRAEPLDIREVVSGLRFGHLDPAGREITDIGRCQHRNPDITVRLDRQANTSEGAANLQIQVNDVALVGLDLRNDEGTTIAQVLVPADIYATAFACPETENARTHLLNVVRSALLQSIDSFGSQYSIANE